MTTHIEIDLDTSAVMLTRDLPDVVLSTDMPGVSLGVPGPTGPTGPTGIVMVHHGSDPNVARPDAPIVYWVGPALPVNAVSTDFYTNQ